MIAAIYAPSSAAYDGQMYPPSDPSVMLILFAQAGLGQTVPSSSKPSSNFTGLKVTGLPQCGRAMVIARPYLSRFMTVNTFSGASVTHASARCRPSSWPARREH
jgi:hypothetical protein